MSEVPLYTARSLFFMNSRREITPTADELRQALSELLDRVQQYMYESRSDLRADTNRGSTKGLHSPDIPMQIAEDRSAWH